MERIGQAIGWTWFYVSGRIPLRLYGPVGRIDMAIEKIPGAAGGIEAAYNQITARHNRKANTKL